MQNAQRPGIIRAFSVQALLLTKEEYGFSREVVLCVNGERTTPSAEAAATPPS